MILLIGADACIGPLTCQLLANWEDNWPMDTIVITVITAVFASTGFWAFVTGFLDRKSAQKELLVGLAHDRIIYLGGLYLERGSITKDEYENLHDYLYKPYAKLGGNGTAQKVMEDVKKLPITK